MLLRVSKSVCSKAAIAVKPSLRLASKVNRRFFSTSPLVKNHYEFQTCVELQEKACALFGDKPVLGTKNGNKVDWMTYKEFGSEIQKFRNVLASKGFKFDDKLALICNNRVEWAVTMYGTLSLGGQIVPMYEAQLEKDWKYIIESSDAKVVVVATDAIYQKVKDYVGKVGRVETVILLDGDESQPHTYKSLMKAAVSAPPTPASDKVTPSHIAKIIYTSGTTGNPKGVELSHSNIAANVYGLKQVGGVHLHDNVSLAHLPWAHIYAMTVELHTLLSTGSALAIIPSRNEIMAALDIVRPTAIYTVPAVANKLYEAILKEIPPADSLEGKLYNLALTLARHRNEKLEFGQPVSAWMNMEHRLADKFVLSKLRARLGGRVKYMVSGGAAISVKVLRFFEDIGVPFTELYGLTETSPVMGITSVDWSGKRLGTVGPALPGVQVRIIDPETLQERPKDTDGEVTCASACTMQGYRKNPTATAETFYEHDGKRFFRSGDIGQMVDGRFLKITGRIKEQFKLENAKFVVPAPLEDALCRAQLVFQTFIVGMNKPHTVALVVPDWNEVRNWVNANKEGKTKELVALLPTAEQLADSSINTIPLLSHPVFTAEVSAQLIEAGAAMKSYERPAAWVAILHPFTPENHQLTPKMSLRRQNILAKYQPLLDQLYEGKVGVTVGKKKADRSE